MKRPAAVRRPRPLKRIDLLIGGVLLVAAAGSAIGVVTYEDDRVATFLVTWVLDERELILDALTRTGGGEVEATTEVTLRNLTRAAWVVRVSGGAARLQDVDIRVEVVSPANVTASAEASLPAGPTGSVEIPLEMEVASAPTTASVAGPSLDAARSALNATRSSTSGVGTWTVRVSIAPTAPGPLGGTETFSIAPSVTFTTFSAELAVETPEVTRG